MNYGIMNPDEILRLAEPETPLEKKLFGMVDGMQSEIDDLEEECSQECGGCASYESTIESLDGRIDDLEKDVKNLEKLLDENSIEY